MDKESALTVLDPRQELFIDSYFNVNSKTFGNCYKSAIKAGYSDLTARNLTHNKPTWLSEKIGELKVMEPELLVLKLSQIINNSTETTANKLKAIDMLMKHNGMYGSTYQNNVQINIQDVLS